MFNVSSLSTDAESNTLGPIIFLHKELHNGMKRLHYREIRLLLQRHEL